MNALLARMTGAQNSAESPVESAVENDVETTDLRVPDEWLTSFDADPAPARPDKAAPVPEPVGKVTPAMRNRIGAEVEMYVDFLTLPLLAADPVCGQAIADQAAPIGKAIAKILTRYPELAHKFVASGAIADWIGLGIALKPVAVTIYEHHFSGKHEEHAPDDVIPDTFDPFRAGL